MGGNEQTHLAHYAKRFLYSFPIAIGQGISMILENFILSTKTYLYFMGLFLLYGTFTFTLKCRGEYCTFTVLY